MALGKCKECGATVSSTARTCPQCGARKPQERASRWNLIIGAFIALSLIGATANLMRAPASSTTPSSPKPPPEADAKSNASTATPSLAQTNAYKLLHAMAIDCRSAVKGAPIEAAKASAYRSDLYLSQSEWQGLGAEDRAELERLMATAFPDRRWAVHAATAKSERNCREAPVVMASKPTASELAAEAKSRQNMEDGKFKATRSCQRAIADILNDPDSAKYLEDEVVISDGRYLVTQAVRGKNAFGGVIKNTFQCVVLPGTFQAAVLPR